MLKMILERTLNDLPSTYGGVLIHALQKAFDLNEEEVRELKECLLTEDDVPINNEQYRRALVDLVGLIEKMAGNFSHTPPPEKIEDAIKASNLPSFLKDNKTLSNLIYQYWAHIVARDPNWPEKILKNLDAANYVHRNIDGIPFRDKESGRRIRDDQRRDQAGV